MVENPPASEGDMGSIPDLKISVGAIVVFMSTNIAVSGLALIRSTERLHDIEAKTVWQQFMDERFPDERIEKIYPNMIQVK